MGARKLPHVTVDDVDTQGQDNGDHDQLGHQYPVIAEIRPEVNDTVEENYVRDRGDPDRQVIQFVGQLVRRFP